MSGRGIGKSIALPSNAQTISIIISLSGIFLTIADKSPSMVLTVARHVDFYVHCLAVKALKLCRLKQIPFISSPPTLATPSQSPHFPR
jgi:hypothetical protein